MDVRKMHLKPFNVNVLSEEIGFNLQFSCAWIFWIPSCCHLEQKTHTQCLITTDPAVGNMKGFHFTNSNKDIYPHLYHVDNMIWQPEQAKHHHNSQDEFLAANMASELGLPEAFQDEDVAGDDDGVRKDESWHSFQGILESHLCTSEGKNGSKKHLVKSVFGLKKWMSALF